MRILKLLSIITLFFLITFGIIGGCGSGSDGDGNGEVVIELICDDGIDNDGNGFTDCEDLACVIDPVCEVVSCEAIFDSLCDRFEVCELGTFEDCILVFELLGFNCENIESTATQECIDDLNIFDCEDVEMGNLPDSCADTLTIIGSCDECEVDADCPGDLFCFECFENCTGEVNRCSGLLFFLECTDGIFRTQE